MDKAHWDPLKNVYLKQTRGITFDEIIHAKLLGITEHPIHAHQNILIYEYKQYVWAVPCVINKNGTFLKTIYKSRKLMKKYNKENLNDKDEADKI